MWTNQNLSFTRALGDMLIYAEAIVGGGAPGAAARESRRRPTTAVITRSRDDAHYLKTTIAKYDRATGGLKLEYEAVPLPLSQPRIRNYGKVETTAEKTATPVAAGSHA